MAHTASTRAGCDRLLMLHFGRSSYLPECLLLGYEFRHAEFRFGSIAAARKHGMQKPSSYPELSPSLNNQREHPVLNRLLKRQPAEFR